MPTAKKNDFITVEEYLNGELISEVKHEYVDGQVFAMAGATPDHGRISSNINRILGNHLIDNPCEPFISDMKVKTSISKYRYPDVLVICDDNFIENGNVTETPTIIVEVLSKSTRKTDERDKLLEYINLPTLKEYVIVEQYCADVTVYRRSEKWFPKHYFLGENIHFESIDLTLSVEEIYHRVKNEDMIDFLKNQNKQ
ncbi:MAG: Uma2 family endonuclease [Colwellia sp.]|nr:Uma2 family endonuclease [Colwellia sp.]